MSNQITKTPLWKVIFSSAVLAAVSYIVVGVVLVAYPEISYVSLCYIAATAVMLIGLIDVIRYILRGITEGKLNNYLSRGLILVLISIFMFVRSDYMVIVLPILLGLAIVIDGIIKLQRSVDLLRLHFEGWVFVLILSAMSLAIGAVLVFRPLDSAKTLTMVMGIALIYCGVTMVVVSIFVNLKLRNYHETAVPVKPMEVPAKDDSVVIPPMTAPAAPVRDESVVIPPMTAPARDESVVIPPMSVPVREESVVIPPMTVAAQEESPWVSAMDDEPQPMVSQNGEIPFENINLDSQD